MALPLDEDGHGARFREFLLSEISLLGHRVDAPALRDRRLAATLSHLHRRVDAS